MSKLATVLKTTFNYRVIRKLLSATSGKSPHAQLNKYIADFIYEEDAHRTLLLIYYAGHGGPKSVGNGRHGLTLSGWVSRFLRFTTGLMGKRQSSLSETPKKVNEIVWKLIEGNLQQTKGDVLEIFDWSV